MFRLTILLIASNDMLMPACNTTTPVSHRGSAPSTCCSSQMFSLKQTSSGLTQRQLRHDSLLAHNTLHVYQNLSSNRLNMLSERVVPSQSCGDACLQVLKVPADLAYHGTGPMVSARVHDLSVLWRRTKQMFEACSRVSLFAIHMPSSVPSVPFSPSPTPSSVGQVCKLYCWSTYLPLSVVV